VHHFLNKNHIQIVGTSSSVIADRIVDILRKFSIYAIFNTKEANLYAKTQDGIEFTISMFKSKNNESVLLEAQKLCGCSASFHKLRRSILRAAQGFLPELSSCTVFCPLPSINMLPDIHLLLFDPEEQLQDTIRTLEECENMLSRAHIDFNLLGIEMLQSMTDTTSTFHTVAIFVAKAVLGGNSRFLGLSKKITSFLATHVLGWPDDEHFDYLLDLECSATLSYKVLRVLSNALTLLEDDELKIILNSKSFPCNKLVAILMDVLKEASTQPHDAYLSAKCLAVLVRESEEAYTRAMELDAPNALLMSREIGERSHQLLADGSKQALVSMRCA